MGNAKDYYDLYMESRKRIKQEELLQESIIYSIVRNMRKSGTQFIADIVGYYYHNDTKKAWEKQFFAKMEEHFFGDVKWKFKSIIQCGWEKYSYRVEFMMNEVEYSITIPNPLEINCDNIVHANFGRYELIKKTSNSSWKHICDSYDMSDIAAAIKKESEV